MKKILATPAAKRITKEHNLSLDTLVISGEVTSSSHDGAIRARDIQAAITHGNLANNTPTLYGSIRMTPLAKQMVEVHGISTEEVSVYNQNIHNQKVTKADILQILDQRTAGTFPESQTSTLSQVIPLAGMRKIIAENMMHSLHNHAQTTVFSELDTTELVSIHKSLKEAFMQKYEIKLTFNHLFIKLITLALQEHPMVNSALIDTDIHVYNHIHMGVATAIDNGLIVPVIRDCQNLSLQEIAQASHTLVDKARKGSLTPSEYSDGTFTISNLGNVAVDCFTPILNSPQTGIMGIARTVKKPVVRDDTITIRSMTHFCLTFDHRVIDGMVAAQFMNTIDRLLSNPATLLL